MIRFLVYFFIVVVIIFIPFKVRHVEVVQIPHAKSTSVNVKLVTPIKEKQVKPKIEKQPEIKKKPKPKKRIIPINKIVKEIPQKVVKSEPVKEIVKETSTKVESQTSMIQNTQIQEVFRDTSVEDKYYARLYDTINENKRYPKKAIKFGQQDEISVSFIILKNGEITSFKILKESKYSSLNEEVKRMFKKIKMFEKPPSQLQTPFVVEITISFKLS